MLTIVGGIPTVIVSVVAFAAAAAIWHSLAGGAGARARSVVMGLALVAFLVFNQRHPILRIRHAKGQEIANEVFQQWNTFSAISCPFAWRMRRMGTGDRQRGLPAVEHLLARRRRQARRER